MKRLAISLGLMASTVFLVGCGQTDRLNVVPLDPGPTPSCVAIESNTVEEWDHDVIEQNYSGRYCLDNE